MFVRRTWHRRRRPPYHRGWRTGSGRRRRKTWNDTAVGPRQPELLADLVVRIWLRRSTATLPTDLDPAI
jgi:hypothetical protein